MGVIAEMIDKTPGELAALAVELLAKGEIAAAQCAARLANDGRDCPFGDGLLRAAWGRSGRHAPRPVGLTLWPSPARTQAAVSASKLDEAGQ